jgi:hypothetical protein
VALKGEREEEWGIALSYEKDGLTPVKRNTSSLPPFETQIVM